jgi:hypothetical protein
VATLVLAAGAYGAGKITGEQIKDGTITGVDVKNKSLTPADFKGSVQGPAGPLGAIGPQGPAGPSTLSGITAYYGQMTVPAGAVNGGFVSCPPGQRMVSGGYATNSGVVFFNEATDDQTGWLVAVANVGSSVAATLEADVNCAGAGQAVAARAKERRMVPVRDGRAARLIAERRSARG